jgi:hypothetical protein
MPRMFEVKYEGSDGDVLVILDLEKVYLVRVDTPPGHAYPRITVRFVDGHEHHDITPPISSPIIWSMRIERT